MFRNIKSINKILQLILISFFITENAYAYLDPGSGSIILSAIIAILATMKHYWLVIKNFFNKKFLKKNHKLK